VCECVCVIHRSAADAILINGARHGSSNNNTHVQKCCLLLAALHLLIADHKNCQSSC